MFINTIFKKIQRSFLSPLKSNMELNRVLSSNFLETFQTCTEQTQNYTYEIWSSQRKNILSKQRLNQGYGFFWHTLYITGNKKLHTCFVHFTKAFDSIWRKGLLSKMKQRKIYRVFQKKVAPSLVINCENMNT